MLLWTCKSNTIWREKQKSIQYILLRYLFHGGTSFGFKSAAHDFGTFFPITTSYDFDAPISEAGDLTEKFFKIKKTIETVCWMENILIKQKLFFIYSKNIAF